MYKKILLSLSILLGAFVLIRADVVGAYTCGSASTTGVHTIDLDGPGGIGPITTYCDMDNDDGGWVLISAYDVNAGSWDYNHWADVSSYFSTIFSGMEVRYEIHTNQGRVYKQYNQVTNIKGANHLGRDVWFGSCKTNYSDAYAGNDWVIQYDGSDQRCSGHWCAQNDPQNYWQNNVVNECHRTVQANDGSQFIAQKNTYYSGWRAYCGGMGKGAGSMGRSSGCAVPHTFETIGPEGLEPTPPGWYGYWRQIGGQTHRKVYVRSESFIDSTPTCQLYAVHDEKLNDSQFFTINSNTLAVNALGDMHKAYDIEALDIHPQTTELFAASGKDTQKPGYLYRVDKNNGQLTDIGSTGFKEIDGLSFHPDGTLWGWATGDGLVTINTATGQASLVAAYSGEVEDLTWNAAGTTLFGVENVQNNPDVGVKLLTYDGNTVTTVCDKLTQSLEIEALDALPDDTLIFGLHGQTGLPLGVIDTETCQITAETEIATDYNDVEGIAWPNCQ